MFEVALITLITSRSAGITYVLPTFRVISFESEGTALSVTLITRSAFAPNAVGIPETVPSAATAIHSGPETFENV